MAIFLNPEVIGNTLRAMRSGVHRLPLAPGDYSDGFVAGTQYAVDTLLEIIGQPQPDFPNKNFEVVFVLRDANGKVINDR